MRMPAARATKKVSVQLRWCSIQQTKRGCYGVGGAMGLQMLGAIAAALVVVAFSVWAADFGQSRNR